MTPLISWHKIHGAGSMNLNIFLLIAGLFFITRLPAQESRDSTRYIQGLPVTGQEYDTLNRSTEDRPPKDLLIEIPKDQIPSKLRETLDKEEEYKDWANFPVFQNRNTKLYEISITRGNTTRTYGFNENGKVITFGETTKRKDRKER
jgi:hypothetical protein